MPTTKSTEGRHTINIHGGTNVVVAPVAAPGGSVTVANLSATHNEAASPKEDWGRILTEIEDLRAIVDKSRSELGDLQETNLEGLVSILRHLKNGSAPNETAGRAIIVAEREKLSPKQASVIAEWLKTVPSNVAGSVAADYVLKLLASVIP